MSNFHKIMRAGSRYDGKTEPRTWSVFNEQFTGQHTNSVRAARRSQIKASGGIRQFKKVRKQMTRT